MANPTITSRPSKTISGYEVEWIACGGNLPVEYQITNTKWPLNSEDTARTPSAVSDASGFLQVSLSGSPSGYSVGDYIKVTGNYAGVYQIKSITNLLVFVLDTSYIDSTPPDSVQPYYKNYLTEIEVYTGIKAGHPHARTFEKIATIKQKPGSDNITRVNLAQYIKTEFVNTYDDTQASWPNDINAWTNFFIRFREVYTDSATSFVSDSTFTLYGINSAKQFGDANGAVMYNYILTDETYAPQAQFMTVFTKLYFAEESQEVSLISDDGTFDIVVQKYLEGALQSTQTISYSGNGFGVYRISLLGVDITDVDELRVYADTGTTQSETIIFEVEDCTANQPPDDNWILANGTWNDDGIWIDTEVWID